MFASYYLGPNTPSMHNRCQRNKDVDEHNSHVPTLSVFEPQGAAIGKERSKYLIDAKYIGIDHLHVLLNCDVVRPYTGWVLPFKNKSCIKYMIEKKISFTMCTKCRRIFI